MRISFCAAVSAVMTLLSNSGHAAPPADTPERIARIEHGIEPVEIDGKSVPIDIARLMKLNRVPGLSIAVIDDYHIAWTKGFGVTEAGGSKPVTTRTLFQAGSISKPVAATAMLQLVEQGKLSLDEDVNVKLRTWKVPENEFTAEQKVTLRRLASHTAGLTVHGFPGYDVDSTLPTLVQIFDGTPPANTPAIRVNFVPGSKSRYSGGGVTIEQQLMVDVTGETFPELMKTSVLAKLGMDDSTYLQPLPPDWSARAASGTHSDGKTVHGHWHVYPEMAAAGLWTTSNDLALFAIETALAKQGKSARVLSQDSTRERLRAQPGTDGKIGLGFFVSDKDPGVFEHNGADDGFQADFHMDADTGKGFVIMANSDNGMLVAWDIARSIAQEYAWKDIPPPRSVARELALIAQMKGVSAALLAYKHLRASPHPREPADEGILEMVGYVMAEAGEKAEAIKAFAENVAEYPNSSNAFTNLGQAYAEANNKTQATANFEKALKLDANNADAKEGLKKLGAKD